MVPTLEFVVRKFPWTEFKVGEDVTKIKCQGTQTKLRGVATGTTLIIDEIAEELRKTSDDLTRFARTYVITGDSIWENKYWNVIKVRNGKKARPNGRKISLQDSIRKIGITNDELKKIKIAEQNSNKLVYTEKAAFNAL
ncbi:MAG: hypothetical protein DSY97_05480, partial [SAR324 cluster bacterium]